ncbi:MAG: hypothetical protein IH830_03575 [Planctomycetes bacterium]|nr:hypothetical protein [Planctomycetota bacterium]
MGEPSRRQWSGPPLPRSRTVGERGHPNRRQDLEANVVIPANTYTDDPGQDRRLGHLSGAAVYSGKFSVIPSQPRANRCVRLGRDPPD